MANVAGEVSHCSAFLSGQIVPNGTGVDINIINLLPYLFLIVGLLKQLMYLSQIMNKVILLQ